MKRLIKLEEVDVKKSPKVRAGINDEAVNDYRIRYEKKEPMPDIVLFQENPGSAYLIADGLHRFTALSLAGRKQYTADVRKGGYEDALRYALTANDAHGLRRTNEDKKRCVISALSQWTGVSNIQIATLAGVSDVFVGSVRRELEKDGKVRPVTERTGRDGRVTKTDNIGSTPNGSESKVAKKPKDETDDTGYPIPEALLPLWHRDTEVMSVLHQLSAIRSGIAQAQKKEDLLYAEVNFSSVLSDLESAETSLKCAIPYAVCTQCQGHPDTQAKGCRMCAGRGFISKFRYERLAPDEIKKVRAKGKK